MARKRNVDLEAELGADIDLTEEEANAARVEILPEKVTPAPVRAPMQAFTMTAADIQAIVTSAVQAASQGNAALADAVTQGIANAREPIPENKFAPEISVYNPLGDHLHPRPGLRCKVTLATQDAKTKIVKETYPFEANDLTAYEQIALNTLVPWSGRVHLLDGAEIKLSIVPSYNPIDDSIEKLALVIPAHVTEKKSAIKNMLPPICNLVEQITGHNYAKLSLDDLKWFMAEHRSRNYVAARDTVAA